MGLRGEGGDYTGQAFSVYLLFECEYVGERYDIFVSVFLVQAELAREQRRDTMVVAELRRWPAYSRELRLQHGLPSQGGQWTKLPGKRCWGVPRRRCDRCKLFHLPGTPTDLRPEEVIKDLWVNFGQSNKRVPIQKGMQTLATSTLYYS